MPQCTEILTRKMDEEIVVGNNVVIRVVSTTDQRAVLSVTRPADVTVFRRELVEEFPSLVPWFRR